MSKFSWSAIGSLSALYIGILLVQSPLKANAVVHTMVGKYQSSTQRDSTLNQGNNQTVIQKEHSMELDDLYHMLLTTFERFKAVWKQQSGNRAALQRYSAELREHVTALREFQRKGEPTTKPSNLVRSPTPEATAEAPLGPVQPSREPSPEDEVQKRREATLKKFLSGGPLSNSLESKTLTGVPDSWIDKSCDLAEQELNGIDRLLVIDPTDYNAVTDSLAKLQMILYRLDNPPPSTPPVTPKGDKENT